jgi:hypothetical protein
MNANGQSRWGPGYRHDYEFVEELEGRAPVELAGSEDQVRRVGLCRRCAHGTVFHSARQGLTVYCGQIGERIPPDVDECSRFEVNQAVKLSDLEKLAIPVDIRPDPPSRAKGYL